MEKQRIRHYSSATNRFSRLPVRRFPPAGAEVLLEYFGTTGTGNERGAMAALEAGTCEPPENRRWIVRATNDGITAVIDPAGRTMQVLPPYREEVM